MDWGQILRSPSLPPSFRQWTVYLTPTHTLAHGAEGLWART